MNKINVTKLKDEVNLFLFEKYNWGIDKLKMTTQLCEIIGGAINEAIDVANNYND